MQAQRRDAHVAGVGLSTQDVAGNFVRTAKYTLVTFLPLNLFEQFSRIANLYFAFIAILQVYPLPKPFFAHLAPSPL